MSNIRSGDQSQPSKDSNLAHRLSLENLEEGIHFEPLMCFHTQFCSVLNSSEAADQQLRDSKVTYNVSRVKINK